MSAQLPWIILWIGLATLIVGLIVLTRTSWGQSHPLRKCAALSLLVHLLLAAYATTVQIVTAGTTNGNSKNGQISLTLTADPGTTTDQPVNKLDSSALDKLAVDSTLQPTVSFGGPDLLTTPDTAKPQLDAEPSPPAKPLLDKMAVEPLPLQSDPLAVDANRPSLIKPAATIDPPQPPQAKPVADIHPASDGPARQSTATDSPINAGANGASIGPAPLVKVPGESLVQVPDLPGNPAGNQRLPGSGDPIVQPGQTGPAPITPIIESPPGGKNSQITDSSLKLVVPPTIISSNGGVGAPRTGPAPAAAPDIYKDRTASDRMGVLLQRGGSKETEAAVQAALHWLAAHQEPDGHWDAAKYGAGRENVVLGQDRKGAGAQAHTAVTGLAILALQASGNTHASGPYAKNVQHGLEYLLRVQGADGNLGGPAETFAFMYSHGMATFALSEAYAMTHDKRLEEPLRRAISYTLAAQHPTTGGWRYNPRETGDTSQLGWQLMALKSADLAGLPMPQSTRDGAIRFLKSVASGPNGGLASYRPGETPSRTMTAEALVCRQFLGMARDNPSADEAGDALLGELPKADRVNLYYWYYGTLGMYQLQGDHWKKWNEALKTALVSQQATSGDLAGSWDPNCIWGGYGGRIYSTAMSALCLEVYYRYLPLYGGEPVPTAQAPAGTQR